MGVSMEDAPEPGDGRSRRGSPDCDGWCRRRSRVGRADVGCRRVLLEVVREGEGRPAVVIAPLPSIAPESSSACSTRLRPRLRLSRRCLSGAVGQGRRCGGVLLVVIGSCSSGREVDAEEDAEGSMASGGRSCVRKRGRGGGDGDGDGAEGGTKGGGCRLPMLKVGVEVEGCRW
jgi:hypothetical protein